MEELLVNVEKVLPNVVLDIRYATDNNFLQRSVYPKACCFIHRDIVGMLKAVVENLENRKLKLKIFDAFRPLSVSQIFWEEIQDPRYVAPPQESRHARGTAVDVTLLNFQGEELAMPTDFDDFSEKAHADYPDLPKELLANRDLLQEVMVENGFKIYPYEWWHFDLQGYEFYPQLDTDFETLIP